MKKIFLFMSLLLGTLVIASCSSSNDEEEQPFETYNSVSFSNFIKSQYSSSQSLLVMEICDNNFYNTSDGYTGEIAIGGYVLVKNGSGNYSIDGYRYSGRIENNNRDKVYNANQGKAFSISLDKSDDKNFIINGYIAITENRNITQDKYSIKPSTKYAESMEVKANGTTVVTKTGVLETFIEQCQNIGSVAIVRG